MSTVRQKQVFNGENGLIYYEITFTALAHDWITNEQYEEVSEMIDNRLLRPESFEAQTAYDALTFMMDTWRMNRHIASDEWKAGFRSAWIAAGGHPDDLK
jgi:hypothetical protein